MSAIAYDSRQVTPGAVFVALRGVTRRRRARSRAQALARGAIAVVAETAAPAGIDGAVDAGRATRALALAALAAAFYGDPSDELALVGITGTNGKTTTRYLLASIFEAAGMQVRPHRHHRLPRRRARARRGAHDAGSARAAAHAARDGRRDGCGACVMEVSSHALALRRADDLRFAAGVFTNLTRDHLDFHGDMEDVLRRQAPAVRDAAATAPSACQPRRSPRRRAVAAAAPRR